MGEIDSYRSLCLFTVANTETDLENKSNND